jgi:hypothetical protein
VRSSAERHSRLNGGARGLTGRRREAIGSALMIKVTVAGVGVPNDSVADFPDDDEWHIGEGCVRAGRAWRRRWIMSPTG